MIDKIQIPNFSNEVFEAVEWSLQQNVIFFKILKWKISWIPASKKKKKKLNRREGANRLYSLQWISYSTFIHVVKILIKNVFFPPP